MAFKMDGEMALPATRQAVWDALNDPDVLRRCINGCQKLDRAGDNAFVAEVKMKIGPVSSIFNGKVQLSDLNPPNSYRIDGQGDGGAAGFAKGGANVLLSDVEGGTLLRYEVNADVGGRLAQLGGRLINGVAKKQADLFFAAFATQFGEAARTADGASEAASEGVAGTASATASHGVSPAIPAAGLARTTSSLRASSPPWAWLFALAAAIIGGFVLGRSGADSRWVVVTTLIALASAGAGYGAAARGKGS